MKNKKYKISKKKIIKHIKSTILKILLIVGMVSFPTAAILQEDTKFTRLLAATSFLAFGIFMFLLFVCDFEIIEKVKKKKSSKYLYKINNIEIFLEKFLCNSKKYGGEFITREELNDNVFYFYNIYDEKIVDVSVYYWYVIIVLNNKEVDYINDWDKLLLKVRKKYYKSNQLSKKRSVNRISSIFIMNEEDKKVMKLMEQNGYSFDQCNEIIFSAISVSSQILYIPSINDLSGSYPYWLMKRKMLKLLRFDKNKIEVIKNKKKSI